MSPPVLLLVCLTCVSSSLAHAFRFHAIAFLADLCGLGAGAVARFDGACPCTYNH